MPAVVSGIEPGSPAARARVRVGDVLLSVNGHAVADVLDYRFYAAEKKLRLRLRRPNGKERTLRLRKEQYADLGLQFTDGLMDDQRQCRNRCVFCFIDQLPPGLRPSLYVKDDDARLSFLFGNYITLTNLDAREAERIIQMRLSPINVSVHTMDPALRVRMMKNPRAGEVLALLPRFAAAGLELNIQLVLCPGWNDGAALADSLERLLALPGGRVRSVAAVPVGLTKHRAGLEPLRPFTKTEAGAVIDCIAQYRAKAEALGLCVEICPSDEFFLLAERAMPGAAYYGAFAQLENGVGLWALLKSTFLELLEARAGQDAPMDPPRQSIVTGKAAAPLLRELVAACAAKYPGVQTAVFAVENDFFGEHITVAGLLTGRDICAQLRGRALGERVLLPRACLRSEGDLTLDGMTLAEISEAVGTPCYTVQNNAAALLEALLGAA